MPRRNLTIPAEDVIQRNAALIREYIENGEAYLGTEAKAKANGHRAKLTHLRNWAYHQMAIGQDPDNRGACVYLLLRDAEIDTDPVPAPDNMLGERQVRVYWRPDRVMTARAKAGLPIHRTQDELNEVEEAKKRLLTLL